MLKILITGGNGMLAADFKALFSDSYQIYSTDSDNLDITDIAMIREKITELLPDVVLNFAAYTAVDDAEDMGMKINYDVNTLGVYNLAKVTAAYNIDFLTISSDYVFSGNTQKGYGEHDKKSPVNQYGMAKYLSEKLALSENKNTVIIRTSWLYGGGKNFKNFVNTMMSLGKKLDTLKVIDDQFGNPTNCKDLSIAITQVLSNIGKYRGETLHFSNATAGKGVSWYDFAQEIFKETGIEVNVQACKSLEFPTKAKRPHYSKLINNSDIVLKNWKEGLKDYLNNV